MKKRLYCAASRLFILLSVILFSPIANADELSLKKAKQYLGRAFPNAEVDSLKPAAIPDMYEIIIGSSIYYLTADGKFLLAGSLYDLQSGDDLTQRAYNELRRGIVDRLAAHEAITYASPEYKYTINVFSDVECPSCRNFHGQIEQVNALGIRVRYFLTPYLGDTAYRKAVSVWCADDRTTALDNAKRGTAIEQKQCDNPIDENLRIAEILDIKGTPSFLLEDGKLLQGYRTPQVLLDEAKRITPLQNK